MTTQIEMALPSVEWKDQVRPLVIKHFRGAESFTADDLHGLAPEPPHPNAYGSLLNAMCKQKLIEQTGYTTSQRASRNGGLIRVWRVR